MADATLLGEFVLDSLELLDDAEPKLIELQASSQVPDQVNTESINSIFRLFHSMKGSAGMLELHNITSLTHEAETLLDMFRSGKTQMTRAHMDTLFKAMDLIREILASVDANLTDKGFEDSVSGLVEELGIAISQGGGDASPAPKAKKPEPVKPPEPPPPPPEPVAKPEPEPAAAADFSFDEFEIPITQEMLDRFVTEADELLEQCEAMLLTMEDDTTGEPVHEAFRAMHSFKGNCGFMGLSDPERMSHRMENVLSGVKEGIIAPTSDNTGILLKLVDILRDAVADVSSGGKGHIDNLELYVQLLDEILPEASEPDAEPEPAAEPQAMAAGPAEPASAPGPEEESPLPSMEIKLEEEKAPEAPQDAAGPKAVPAKPKEIPATKAAPRTIVRQDIRVDLAKLDHLINLVGELVIAETMVTRNPDLVGHDFENFEKSAMHLSKIVRDLQDISLSVRMIPIAGVFRKMIRLVHDLSAKAGKKINLTLVGEDTEIDKTVAEIIADPLVHLVRNSIDHGLEPPDERKTAGKEETGEILLQAGHEGGEVWILIRDDGRGLSRENILAKAIERGLVNGDGSDLSDSDVYNMIFHPGFSTAKQVTDISGRGVGMDVVKKNIERIKGHIDVRNNPGHGCTIVLRLPLTMAIIEGLLVRVGKAKYTIPLLAVRENIQVTKEMITKTMDGQELVMVRGQLLPIYRVHELHNTRPDNYKLEEGLLVIVENRGEMACLFVDEILGDQQAVIKGLSNYIGSVRGVSGCTILGDGEVSLILDVAGLIRKAQGLEAA
ncbi:two-component system, chemotaxis family, sensor kinase CheA [Desulfatibacillum alkenivorans DSM 16219]|uniref:Chemotaxis protein CheA n=1 Tax=Desulfatibacillum alkenivorans DSM 16219 TaxID=1121393 RepID=A0A1M6F3E9_9BACT|nr:chemotaxis protein CheA [Desulfatibacillum alkenivorans]SHI92238.1 two-component system, chemotaxis family, sensor kinase CheA [Desulfatibacillum alkenivorans DSM 16219]